MFDYIAHKLLKFIRNGIHVYLGGRMIIWHDNWPFIVLPNKHDIYVCCCDVV